MFLNRSAMEINFRVVLCGPPSAGARETVEALYANIDAGAKGDLVRSRSSELETSFFDFVPPGLAPIHGLSARFHLVAREAAAAGARPCDLSRLPDVDGVLFVAPTAPGREGETAAALGDLRASLDRPDRPWVDVPVVLVLGGLGEGPVPGALRRLLEAEGRPLVEARVSDRAALVVALKAAMRETLAGLRDGRLREWSESEDERARGEAFLARARVVGHHGRYLGEAEDELGPDAPPPGCPVFVVTVHGPTPARPCVALATAGFSTVPQGAAAPGHRLELVGYASRLDGGLASALAELGRRSVAPQASGPWRAHRVVELGNAPPAFRHLLLLPPPEAPGYGRSEDELWSHGASGGERGDLALEIVWAVPLPERLVAAAAEVGRELVAAAMRGEPGVRTRWESWREG